MLSLETLFRDAGVTKSARSRAEAILAERGPDLLRETIDALPERQRIVLALRFYEALEPGEIAAVLGTKLEQVDELMGKAVAALCAKLERTGARKNGRRPGAVEGAVR